MYRSTILFAALAISVPFWATGEDQAVEQQKARVLQVADRIFGKRLAFPKEFPPSLDDLARIHSNSALYDFGNGYVAELFFSRSGALAKLKIYPHFRLEDRERGEAERWSELTEGDLNRILSISEQFQPRGHPTEGGMCFSAIGWHDCVDHYENAQVVRGSVGVEIHEGEWKDSLRDVTISYSETISGRVEDKTTAQVGGGKGVEIGEDGIENEKIFPPDTLYDLKVNDSWYRVGEKTFGKATKGMLVKLKTTGCADNGSVCGVDVSEVK